MSDSNPVATQCSLLPLAFRTALLLRTQLSREHVQNPDLDSQLHRKGRKRGRQKTEALPLFQGDIRSDTREEMVILNK